ncbi:MAG: hypothetical protein DRJ52_01440 [Thermoprotei archaeon]|nr:MAG: hypothetical protein DRJ52_01440 [Thermoprotei archaeon]HDI74990.1 hypothetical protein [Thermoprotei archaeon]
MKSFRIYYSRGLRVKIDDITILLDPKSSTASRADLVLVTHAHQDHAGGYIFSSLRSLVVSSKITKSIVEKITRRRALNVKTIQENKQIDFGKFSVYALNAGHVMGSLQYIIEFPDLTLCYTGDINLVDTITEKRASIPEGVDVLIIESTYGSEDFVFPPRSEIYSSILEWVEYQVNRGEIVVLGGYALGKGQELTALLKEILDKIAVSRKVFFYNRIFEKERFSLENYVPLESSEGRKLVQSGGVVVVPHLELRKHTPYTISRRLGLSKGPKVAVCTGWAAASSRFYAIKRAFNVDMLFPLSSHADVEQLLSFVDEVRPRLVYTVHGFSRRLAKLIRQRLGIKARRVFDARQQTLTRYVKNL